MCANRRVLGPKSACDLCEPHWYHHLEWALNSIHRHHDSGSSDTDGLDLEYHKSPESELDWNIPHRSVVSSIYLLLAFTVLNTWLTQRLRLSVCITSIIRITKLFQVDSNDVTFRLLNVHVWTSVEASIGVLCACLPTLRRSFHFCRRSIDSKGANEETGPLFGRFLNKGSRERPLGLKSGGPGSRSATKEHFTRLADDHSRGPGLSSPNGGGNSSSSSGSPRSADSVQLEKLGVHSSPRLDRHSGTEDEESARFDDCSGQHNPRALEQPYAL